MAAKQENLSRAAEILHTSQPSLSQTIKRLEEELGYVLFDREGKHIRLNESGRIMAQTVTQMEELMYNTRLKLEEMNGRDHPEVSIYIGCASTLLPELLQFLRKRSPQVQYRIHQWNMEEHGREDGIQILASADQGGEVLLEEEILLALPKEHSLLMREHILLEDLTNEEFISLNEKWELGRVLKREMENHLFVPRVTMRVDNPNLMRELLRAQMGIAFTPGISWHSFAGEEVVMRRVEDCPMRRKIYLHTRPGMYLTREYRECIQGIREFFTVKKQIYS